MKRFIPPIVGIALVAIALAWSRPASTAPPVNLKGFTCDSTAVKYPTRLADVHGATGDVLLIKPTGDPCEYDLSYRDVGGHVLPISEGHAMFLLADAKAYAISKGTRKVACVSAIQHSPYPGAKPGPRTGINRVTDSVPLQCAVSNLGQMQHLSTIVNGGKDWAAWVVSVVDATPASLTGPQDNDNNNSSSNSGDHGDHGGGDAVTVKENGDHGDGKTVAVHHVYTVRYVRDSTFQFLNISDKGRPATDGIYEATFDVVTGGKFVVTNTVKISNSTATTTTPP